MVQSGIERAFGPQLRRFLDAPCTIASRPLWPARRHRGAAEQYRRAGREDGGCWRAGRSRAGARRHAGANDRHDADRAALSFEHRRVAPLFVLVGVVCSGAARPTVARPRCAWRSARADAVALQQLLALLTPYEDVPSLRLLLGAIATQPVIDVVIAAALTWAAHSSVATVLLDDVARRRKGGAASGGFRPCARRQSRFRAQPAARRRRRRRSGDEAGTDRQSAQSVDRRVLGLCCSMARAVAGHDTSRTPGGSSPISTRVQPVTAALFVPLLGPFARLLMQMLPARACRRPGKPVYLIRPRTSPGDRAGRSGARGAAHGRHARSDVAGRSRCALLTATANGSARRKGSMTCSTISTGDQGLSDRTRPELSRR